MPGARPTPATLLMPLLVLLMLMLPGCWSNIELEQRALVAGLGVDRSPDGRLLVTAQIVRPELVARRRGGQGGGGEEAAVFVLSAEARTVVEATRIISKDSGLDLFFPYTEVLVVGEGLAREGMEPVVDWVGRDRQVRLGTWVAVSPGPAREVMANTTVFVGRVPAFAIGRTISTVVEEDSRVPRIAMLDFLQAAARPGQEPVAVRLSLEEGAGDRKQVQATGSAVFRGYRLAGWLTEMETRGFLWFRGHVRRGYLSGSLSGEDFAAFEIRGYKHKLTSEIREGRPVIKLKIEIKGAVNEVHDPTLPLDRPETLDVLEPLMERQVRFEAEAALAKARELGADIFGFGDVIRRQHREVWAELQEDWENLFPQVPVEIEVKATLRRTEQLGRPILER